MEILLKKAFIEAFANAQKNQHPQLAKHMLGRVDRYGEEEKTFDSARGEETYGPGVTAEVFENLLYDYAKSTKNQAVMMFIGSIRLALKDVKRSKPGSLPALKEALVEYFKEDVVDGWIYKKVDDKFLPFLIRDVQFNRPSARQKAAGAKDSVTMLYIANSTAGTARSGRNQEYDTERWEWGQFNGKTVPELLSTRDLFHESAELKADYVRQLALFDEHRPRFGQQYFSTGTTEYEFDPDDSYHSRREHTQLSGVVKYINDDLSAKRHEIREEEENLSWVIGRKAAPEDSFKKVPVHPYLRMFNLTTHKFAYKHVDTIKLYEFDPSLRDKIVLPESHRDLVEVLVGDLDAVAGDVIEGKGGGTSILCQGNAGLGKTLTAEIYSEVKKLPLYKVHSGQLGTDSESVEKMLQVIFERAQKWGCILLLDEADVYIRRRGDDLDHNAVVACFLRTMEYFSGIFFMTTNRKDDVDDAIRSRCLAIITYDLPNREELRQIFQIHSDNFMAGLSDIDLDLLVQHYTGKIGGRDAKMLLEIASRYATKKGKKVDSETIRMLAQFKGF